MTATLIRIEQIRTDGGTQPRAVIDHDAVADYMEAMQGGIKFPPITVFYDGSEYWLADGFHRCRAAFGAEREEIECDVHQGTQADAQWYSFSANKGNGLRRHKSDIDRAIRAALAHPNSTGLSDNQLAKHIGCSQSWLSEIHRSMKQPHLSGGAKMDSRTVTRNGTTYQQNTANIGRKNASVAQPEERPVCTGMVAGSTPAAGSNPRPTLVVPAPPKPVEAPENDSVELLRAIFTLAEHSTTAQKLVATVPDANIIMLSRKARDAFEFVGFVYENSVKRERQKA